MIHLSLDLDLPADIGTQTTVIFGKRGSGKTSTAVVLAEELFEAQVPFVALDVADVWWGLKAAGAGKGRGLGVYVFGGRHADLPLEPGAGALMADVLVDHRISAVLSMKHFDGRDRSRFVTDFAKRLLQRNSEPLHIFLEEAHELAPENPMAAERQHEMLGAINRLWKLGRSSGIGGSAITQRPASLSKNITTQAEVMIVHRTIGPQDVAAIRAWIKYHGEREDILAQLGSLKTGEAFVWAPDFPEKDPIGLRRVRVRRRHTFDSSATPKAGEERSEPGKLASVDLDVLRDRMAATIERAKEDDPKALRARIRELEAVAVPATIDLDALERVRQEANDRAARATIEATAPIIERGRAIAKAARAAMVHLQAVVDEVDSLDCAPISVPKVEVQRSASAPAPRVPRPIPVLNLSGSTRPEGISGGCLRMLVALASRSPAGFTIAQWATLAKLKRTGGTWSTYLSRLRVAELVEERGGLWFATDAGIVAAGEIPSVPDSPAEVLAMWKANVGSGSARMLDAIAAAGARGLSLDALSDAVSIARSGGTFSTYLSRLRSNGLVENGGDGIRLSEILR